MGISIPDFIVATLSVYAFGIVLGLFPPVALVAPGSSPLDTPDILVLPVLTMMVIGAPYTSRMVRADMIEVMASDYVQTARLLGISERRIILRHALPNALGPAVQIIAATLLWLLGGVIAIEIVFNYPGIGAELVRGVQIRDINFVQSTALVLGVDLHPHQPVADIVVVLLSPRLRSQPAMSTAAPAIPCSAAPRRRRPFALWLGVGLAGFVVPSRSWGRSCRRTPPTRY